MFGALLLALGIYTNHAGIAVSGVPVALTARSAVLSNAFETLELPLSVFPELERRRIAADYVWSHPEVGAERLRVPVGIRRAVEGNDQSVSRVLKRAAKGLCAQDEADAYCRRVRSELRAYLDREEGAGRLLPKERECLRRRH